MHILIALSFLILCSGVAEAASFVWTGAVSADWHIADNWSGGSTPGTADDVEIPPDVARMPVLASDAACRSLTIHEGATVTLDGAGLTVSDFVANAGTLVVGGTLRVAGNWTNDGTVSGSGLMEFNGNGLQQLSGTGAVQTNIAMRGGGAGKVAAGDLDFDGDVEIKARNTFNDGGYAISVAGNWSRRGQFIATGTLILDGADQTFTFGDFGHLTLTGAGVKTPTQGALTLTGDLRIDAGVTLNKGSNTIDIDGTLVQHGTLTGTSNPVVVRGPVINTGVIDIIGTLTLEGTGQTVSGSGRFDTPVLIRGTGTTRAGSDLQFLRGLTVDQNGAFSSQGYELTLGTDGASGSLSIAGQMTLSSGTVLRLSDGSAITVQSEGVLRTAGTVDAGVRITRQTAGGYTLAVADGGTLDAMYTTFEFLMGNGIDIADQGVIHTATALEACVFRQGAGNAYLTIRNSQTLSVLNASFEGGPDRNVHKPVENGGRITFQDYGGALSGPLFEDDPFDQIGWTTAHTETIAPGSRIAFAGVNPPGGADLLLDVLEGSGDLTVSVTYAPHPLTPGAVGRYFTIEAPPGLTADITFFYDPSELGDQPEASLMLWRIAGGQVFGPIPPDERDQDAHSVTKRGLAQFSDWVLGALSGDVPLSVELSRFEAMPGAGRITLIWRTESEVNNLEWHLERGVAREGPYRRIATVPGQGGKPTATDYAYADTTVTPGVVYYYRLIDVESTGATETHGPVYAVAEAAPAPVAYRLHQNAPNPFNPATQICYDLPEPARVTLTVYNILGQTVRTLVDALQQPGVYRIRWDGYDARGRPAPTGLYLYRLAAGRLTTVRKMVLIR